MCQAAVTWREVGDKLQSGGPKWFMASAESDKFCPLCSTNHCSPMQTGAGGAGADDHAPGLSG